MNDDLVSLNTPKASFRLLLLHGWGADAEDLIPLGQEIAKYFLEKLEVIALRAPDIHPQGFGREWYPLYPPDWQQANFAVESLKVRLQAIPTKNLPLEKTVLLGFSQGGAMALAAGCSLPFAGLIGCSAYSHPQWLIPEQSPPVYLTHGKNDSVVPIEAMGQIIDIAKDKGLNLKQDIFNGGHQIPEDLIPNIVEIMKNWLI